ncbi:MAG: SPOR domain-containing protein [Dysgonamonadaceae bacterium]|jgi:hypothetical protein|nr:SPOR domain-containing protein [Dysgonamonadaceae bacterium]
MRKLIFAIFLPVLAISASNAQVKQVTIIDDLKTPETGKGVIEVESDPNITALLGIPFTDVSVGETSYRKANGYRIQVFMSNNASTARSEATQKGNRIRDIFPETATYITFEAPNWKLLAGDFTSREEAVQFRQELRKAFPEFGREMNIVSDKINIPVK